MTADTHLAHAPDSLARAAGYRWLAGIFARETPAHVVAFYRSPAGSALLRGLAGLSPLEPFVKALRARLETETTPQMLALDLAGAYARLFHGAGGRLGAPPCASFYLSETARMMQADASETRAILDALDLRLSDEMHEPPDHVAVQLAVMAHLAETADDRMQAEWLDTRLVPWLDAFAMRCARAPRPDIYAVAACAAADFCDADLKRLRSTARPRVKRPGPAEWHPNLSGGE